MAEDRKAMKAKLEAMFGGAPPMRATTTSSEGDSARSGGAARLPVPYSPKLLQRFGGVSMFNPVASDQRCSCHKEQRQLDAAVKIKKWRRRVVLRFQFRNIVAQFRSSSTAEAKQLRHRFRVLTEIHESEQTYTRMLSDLCERFLQPCQVESAARNGALRPEDVKSIFSCAETIRGLHLSSILPGVAQVMTKFPAMSVGQVFIDNAPFLRCYTDYCNNYPNAASCVATLRKNAKFETFMKARDEAGGDNNKLKLEDLLIIPVQRIPRYKMLLEDLIKHTPETHTDLPRLTQAVDLISKVAVQVNESNRTDETKRKVVDVQTRLRVQHLVAPHRLYIREAEGQLHPMSDDLSDESDRTVFILFNDLLVHATMRSQQLTFVSQMLLFNATILPLPDMPYYKNGFKVMGTDCSYVLLAREQAIRNEWMVDVSEQIQRWRDTTVHLPLRIESSGAARVVTLGDDTLASDSTVGLLLLVLSRANLGVVFKACYDTREAKGMTDMADELGRTNEVFGQYDNRFIVVICSYQAWFRSWHASLRQELMRCGAPPCISGLGSNGSSLPYAFCLVSILSPSGAVPLQSVCTASAPESTDYCLDLSLVCMGNDAPFSIVSEAKTVDGSAEGAVGGGDAGAASSDMHATPQYTVYLAGVSRNADCDKMEYDVNVYLTVPDGSVDRWNVKRAYREFEELKNQLVKLFPLYPFPTFPRRHKLRSRTQSVLDYRQVFLENWIQLLLWNPRVATEPCVVEFLARDSEEKQQTRMAALSKATLMSKFLSKSIGVPSTAVAQAVDSYNSPKPSRGLFRRSSSRRNTADLSILRENSFRSEAGLDAESEDGPATGPTAAPASATATECSSADLAASAGATSDFSPKAEPSSLQSELAGFTFKKQASRRASSAISVSSSPVSRAQLGAEAASEWVQRTAIIRYAASTGIEISFEVGDALCISTSYSQNDWLWGYVVSRPDRSGWFPGYCVSDVPTEPLATRPTPPAATTTATATTNGVGTSTQAATHTSTPCADASAGVSETAAAGVSAPATTSDSVGAGVNARASTCDSVGAGGSSPRPRRPTSIAPIPPTVPEEDDSSDRPQRPTTVAPPAPTTTATAATAATAPLQVRRPTFAPPPVPTTDADSRRRTQSVASSSSQAASLGLRRPTVAAPPPPPSS